MKKVENSIKKTNGKLLEGIVVGNSNEKTLLVEVAYTIMHPLYMKKLKRSTKYQVHSNKKLEIGSKVIIGETKRVSKNKYFRIIEEVK